MTDEEKNELIPVTVVSMNTAEWQDQKCSAVPGRVIHYRDSDGELVDDDGNIVSDIDVGARDRMRSLNEYVDGGTK